MDSAVDWEKEMVDVHKCLYFLTIYERRYEVAGRLYDLLQAIVSSSELPLSPEQSLLKRGRICDSLGSPEEEGEDIHLFSSELPIMPPPINDHQYWHQGVTPRPPFEIPDLSNPKLYQAGDASCPT